jgi:hypothetical protein
MDYDGLKVDNSLWMRFIILISIQQLNELVKTKFVSVFYSALIFITGISGKLLIIYGIGPIFLKGDLNVSRGRGFQDSNNIRTGTSQIMKSVD